MMVAGEASGDLHGGALAEALFALDRNLEIVGFGGGAMREAGVDIRYDIEQLGIVGLIEVLYHFNEILAAYQKALTLLTDQVQVLVLIDFPDFNLRLAKAAKGLGIPVVYYVSPQIWAWRSGRIKMIAERVDRMLVILPFEEKIYRQAEVPCEFVGHPLLDEFEKKGLERKEKTTRPISTPPTLALLPGSRKREVSVLLPLMLAGTERLVRDFPGLQILIPAAPSLPEDFISDLVASSPLPVKILKGGVYEAFSASDLALVASGTATLQGALAGTPMVVIYKISWISYWIARVLVQVKSMSLANIIADAPFIPELIQSEVTPIRIAQELTRLLKDDTAREAMRRELHTVAGRLGQAGASQRAAQAVLRVRDGGLEDNEALSLAQEISA